MTYKFKFFNFGKEEKIRQEVSFPLLNNEEITKYNYRTMHIKDVPSKNAAEYEAWTIGQNIIGKNSPLSQRLKTRNY